MAERLDRFMARANAAYYASKDPFADFTTAPEISQMFGELVGAWAAIVWRSMGAPDPVLLVEAGPGRGTLMADALRTIAGVARPFAAAVHVHLVETSPRLRAAQAAQLQGATWHNGLDSLPPGPAIVIANEFLDALPIRQFVRTAQGWAERHVHNGAFIEQPAGLPDGVSVPALADTGAVLEIGQAARAWTAALATRLVHSGGAALFIDYGTAQTQSGDSLQALRRGRPANPLQEPGTADLTAHVDFAAIANAARKAGAKSWGPVPQGAFLQRLGLSHRTAQLATARPGQADALHQAAARLMAPDQMGTLFKVLCVTHPDCPAPPGFAA